MKVFGSTFIVLMSLSLSQASAKCGGDFNTFVQDLKSEATSRGYSDQVVDGFFASAQQDHAVLQADRRQGVFQLPFVEFSNRLISKNRIEHAAKNERKYQSVFDKIEREIGVSRGVLLAFWAFETDFGAFQGDFNTANALITLSHDCRRPELFRPQVFAALELYKRGNFDPLTTTGAWAGEIGMVQMLPEDILTNGIDGDGDGKVSLKTSAPDALMSAANMLRHLGWKKNQKWLQQVTIPKSFDWSQTGIDTTKTISDWLKLGVTTIGNNPLPKGSTQASIIAPQGHTGPVFFAYDNFRVYFEWNQSFTYVTTAAYFANLLEGDARYDANGVDTGLNVEDMKALQKLLQKRGHDVGKIDGILGAKTRKAVQFEQTRLGTVADAWPTQAFYQRLNQ